jgi:hypothetical protein
VNNVFIWTLHVNVKTNAFVFETNSSDKGRGELEGEPWKWTSYTAIFTSTGRDEVERGTMSDFKITSHYELKFGNLLHSSDTEATAFDCAKLDERKKAVYSR